MIRIHWSARFSRSAYDMNIPENCQLLMMIIIMYYYYYYPMRTTKCVVGMRLCK